MLLTSIFCLSNMQAEGYSNNCYSSVCDTCNDDCCCNRFWADAEYLYWTIQDSPKVFPLVLFSPTTIAPTLLTPDAKVVLGNEKIKNKWRSGGRFALGYWFDDSCTLGIEASYFFLPNVKKSRSVFSDAVPGSGFLSVPFFNVVTGAEDAYALSNSNPDLAGGAFSGFAAYRLKNRMQNAELNAIMNFQNDCNYSIDLIAGFRYWNFDEQFTFETFSPFLAVPGDVFRTVDKFDVENNFYGGQIGVKFNYCCDCFFFNVKGKLALGANCAHNRIHGHLIANDFSVPPFTAVSTFDGGIFALPTNIGHHKKTNFCVIPEVNVNVGYQIMDNLRLQVGYTFLYVSKVLRAVNQIDRNLNPTQSAAIEYTPTPVLAGVPSPLPFHKTRSLWAQGVSAGVEFTF